MDNDKIIAKVRKLLSLSDSHNEHEAFAAAKRARQLMDKHGLTKADIEQSKNDMFLETLAELRWKQRNAWVIQLCASVGKLNDCTAVSSYENGAYCLKFQGFVSDALVAKMTFDYLVSTCERLCNESGVRGRSVRNQFRLGFVTSIQSRVNKMVDERHNDFVQTTGTDLILLKEHQVRAHFGELRTARPMKVRKPTRSELEAYVAGSVAGNNTSLDKQLDGAEQIKITN